MRLDHLLGDVVVSELRGDPGTEITAVTHDSRAVTPEALYCCLPGSRVDGHDFAAAAVDAGAVALLVQHPVASIPARVAQAVVADTRATMGPVAAAFWGHPSEAFPVVGITGTNGKTTTAELLRAILETHGWPAGVIGTLTGSRTTPEATDLQAALAGFRDERRRAVVMEVSSHALDLHRVDGTHFAVGVFTNLSQDHLDHHGDLESYFAAKARLFAPGRVSAAVVNVDDPWGVRLLAMLALRLPVRTFGFDDVDDLVLDAEGSRFTWHPEHSSGAGIRLHLGGRHNVSNALAAATAALILGIPMDDIAAGLASVASVPGRFEAIVAGQPFTVLVDYAHTPDGLAHVLAAAREVAEASHADPSPALAGRVIVVFGCGGDRDPGKRPLMGEAATRLADVAILTNDNPRSEEPLSIIDAVRKGASGPDALARLIVEPDRAAAISLAIGRAAAGDVVVVAGKGHESGQTTGSVTVPFDDRLVVQAALAERFGGTGGTGGTRGTGGGTGPGS